jgi:hypothetical protein
MTAQRALPALLALLLVLPARTSFAQTSDRPPTTVRWWKEAHVTLDNEDKEVRGRILSFTAEEITLDVQGTPRVFELRQVTRVQVEGDGVSDGFFIGMGLSFLLFCLVACGDGLLTSPEGRGATFGSFLYGGLVGAGVDALHTGRTTIYPGRDARKPQDSTSRRAIGFVLRF